MLKGLNREPSEFERAQGEQLKQSILSLHEAMRGAHLYSGVDLSVGSERADDGNTVQRRELVVVPAWAVARTLRGLSSSGDGEYDAVREVRGRTSRPFVLRQGTVSVGYDAWHPEKTANVYGQSPLWYAGNARWDRKELHYSYEFNLAHHGLAVMGVERPLDEEIDVESLLTHA